MPTRYTLDVDFKSVVSSEALENSTKKVEAQKVRPQGCFVAQRAMLGVGEGGAGGSMHGLGAGVGPA